MGIEKIDDENCAIFEKNFEQVIEYLIGLIEDGEYNNFVKKYERLARTRL